MKQGHSCATPVCPGHGRRVSGHFVLHPLAFALACLVMPEWALALPEGFNPVSGLVNQNLATPGVMNLQQGSDRAIVNWNSFNIGATESVNISQPNANSAMLNRVTGGVSSSIAGSLTANGRVFLVNPSGVVFGAGSRVSTGGLVASTLDISDDDFNNGRWNFSRADGNQAAVINRGDLQAGPGGTVALLGAVVRNEGSIKADGGTAALVSARQLSLDFEGDGLTTFRIDPANPASQALVQNAATGLVQADGGRIAILADASSSAQLVVNQEGVLRARSMVQRGGEIILGVGGDDRAIVGGMLDASGGAGLKGGKVSISGGGLYLNDSAVVDVSGAAGGGRVDLLSKQSTALGPGSRLTADAVTDGKGGTINLQGGPSLLAYGTLQSRGAGSGAGGFIETSAEQVDLAGLIVQTTGAPGQLAGTWLIDPFDIRVVHLECCTPPPPLRPVITSPFDPVTDSSVFDSDISAALNAGNSVKIHTGVGNSDGSIGNIFIAPGVFINRTDGVVPVELHFDANGSVTGSGFIIDSQSGPLNVFFNSNSKNILPGSSIILTDSNVTSNGGSVRFYGQSDPQNGVASSVELGNFVINTIGTTVQEDGDITIKARSPSTASYAVGLANVDFDTGKGNIFIKGENVLGTYGLRVEKNSSLDTISGNITLIGLAGEGETVLRPRVGLSIVDSKLNSSSGLIDVRGRVTAAQDGDASPHTIANVIDPDSDRDPGDDIGTGLLRVRGVEIGSSVEIKSTNGSIRMAGESTGGSSGFGLWLAGVNTTISAADQLLIRAATNDQSSPAFSLGESSLTGQRSISLRPGGVNAVGELTDHSATAIQLGLDTGVPGSGISVSNFLVSQATINQLSTPRLILGSDVQSAPIINVGNITVGSDKQLTLQAEGNGGSIVLRAPLTATNGTLSLLADGQISQSNTGTLTSEQLLAVSRNASVLLNNPANAPHVVAGRAAGDFAFTNADNLSIGTVDGVSGVQAGTVFIRNLDGDLTLDQPVTATSGSAVLVTGGRLQNPSGQTISASTFWQIWANTWIGENRGGLVGSGRLPNLYGCAFGGNCASAAGLATTAGDNHFLYLQQPTAQVTITSGSGTFGVVPQFRSSISGLILGDSGNGISGSPDSAFSQVARPGTFSVGGTYTSAEGYLLTVVPGTWTNYLVGAVDARPDWTRERPDTWLYDHNMGGSPMCAAPGVDVASAVQQGDVLAREWSLVKSRPKLSSCVASDKQNGCSDF